MEKGFPLTAPVVREFTTGRLIGVGSAAQVWLLHGDDGLERALKCFPPAMAELGSNRDLTSADQLRREVRILTNFRHSHLLPVHDVVKLTAEWGGASGLLMDFAAGGSLAAVLTCRGSLSPGETVTVLSPMFQVLEFLHGQGVTHGDISLGNILFSAVGKPLMADLGLARIIGEPSADLVVGTEGFIDPQAFRRTRSPRRASGENSLSATIAADIYALCAVGWWCLFGRAPEPTGQISDQMRQMVPDALLTALISGLDADWSSRPDAHELAQEIYRSAAAEPVDLMPSVHPSVLPQMLTRRQIRAGSTSKPMLNADLHTGRRRAKKQRERSAMRVALRFFAAHPARVIAAVIVVFVGATGAFLLNDLLPGNGKESVQAGATASAVAIPADRQRELNDPDPAQAIRGISWLRAEAFRTANAELLKEVNLMGSSAMAIDQQKLEQLITQKHFLDGFSAVVLDVRPVAIDTRTELKVRVELSPFAELNAQREKVKVQASSRVQDLRFIMVKNAGKWLISEVEADN